MGRGSTRQESSVLFRKGKGISGWQTYRAFTRSFPLHSIDTHTLTRSISLIGRQRKHCEKKLSSRRGKKDRYIYIATSFNCPHSTHSLFQQSCHPLVFDKDDRRFLSYSIINYTITHLHNTLLQITTSTARHLHHHLQLKLPLHHHLLPSLPSHPNNLSISVRVQPR